jgi:hypothetical protein
MPGVGPRKQWNFQFLEIIDIPNPRKGVVIQKISRKIEFNLK